MLAYTTLPRLEFELISSYPAVYESAVLLRSMLTYAGLFDSTSRRRLVPILRAAASVLGAILNRTAATFVAPQLIAIQATAEALRDLATRCARWAAVSTGTLTLTLTPAAQSALVTFAAIDPVDPARQHQLPPQYEHLLLTLMYGTGVA